VIEKKNLSPRQLSALTALILSIPISIGIWMLETWKHGIISFALIFGGSYLLILYIFQNFIYSKIKLIYKFIHQTKATKKEETYYKYILPKKSIDDVREDVEKWGLQRSREIELLKKNESFRKEFLQNLSHEFKTPVFAIQGYVDTLLQGALEDPMVNKKFLEKTAKNVERLSNLISDLDEISRLESGEIKLHKQNFVIQDLVKEVFESLSWKAEAKNISFSIKKGCEKPLTVFGDMEKLRQVLTNLLDNSIKYGKQGGEVIASMYNTDDRHILTEISDDGMGIPEKYLDRIFERFFRTTEGRSRDATGSGLGLAISKHIIEAHGENIHVRSKENVGTSIGFTLSTRPEN
jgi:two-component system, OmpR family, phosphate regulon sensor histidine kinase PhoR